MVGLLPFWLVPHGAHLGLVQGLVLLVLVVGLWDHTCTCLTIINKQRRRLLPRQPLLQQQPPQRQPVSITLLIIINTLLMDPLLLRTMGITLMDPLLLRTMDITLMDPLLRTMDITQASTWA